MILAWLSPFNFNEMQALESIQRAATRYTVDLVIFARFFNFREFREEDKFANLIITRNYYYNSATYHLNC